MPPLFWLSLAWLGGLALARLPEPRLAFLWLGSGLLLVMLHAQRLRGEAPLTIAVLIVALLGCWRGLPPVAAAAPPLPDGVRMVRGVIIGWPQPREQALLARLQVTEVMRSGSWQPADAAVEAVLPLLPKVELYDVVEITGRLRPISALSEPDTRQRLHRAGLAGQVMAQRSIIRGGSDTTSAVVSRDETAAAVTRVLDRHLPVPISALAAGVLIGERQGLPAEVRAAFTATGTAHLLVVSGWNMTLVVTFITWVGASLQLHQRRAWVAVVLSGLVVYTILVGGDPAVVRAALMGGLSVVALASGRRADPLMTLLLAAAIMAGLQPDLLMDLGFQLSFLATLGLLVVLPPLLPRLAERAWPVRLVAMSLAVTLAAQLMVEPLLAHTFGRVSLIAPLTNLLVEPWVPLVMAGAFAVAAAGLLGLTWLADLAAGFTVTVALPLLWIVEMSARLPFASLAVPPPPLWLVWTMYAVLAALLSLLLAPRPRAVLHWGLRLVQARTTEIGYLTLLVAVVSVWAVLLST